MGVAARRITTTTICYSPMCRIENNKKEKKLVVKWHNDSFPESKNAHLNWLPMRRKSLPDLRHLEF